MREPSVAPPSFLDRILTSRIVGETAKRFTFPTGEVGAVYTLGQASTVGAPHPVVLVVATFPATLHEGLHDFGIDYKEFQVTTPEEAHDLLAQFSQKEAAHFRASCRAA